MSHAVPLPTSLVATALAEYDALLGLARRQVRCHALAADVVQEVLVQLVQGRVRLPHGVPSRTILRGVTHNVALTALRQRRRDGEIMRSGELPLEIADPTPSAERVVIGRQELRALALAIDALPPRAREVLLLRKFGGLSYAEIGAKLGIAPNTVMVHLGNAVLVLKQCRDGFAR